MTACYKQLVVAEHLNFRHTLLIKIRCRFSSTRNEVPVFRKTFQWNTLFFFISYEGNKDTRTNWYSLNMNQLISRSCDIVFSIFLPLISISIHDIVKIIIRLTLHPTILHFCSQKLKRSEKSLRAE